MQTRRKSLNLGDLGVIGPKRSRTSSHPSPPATVVEGDEPPVKKPKRSHVSESPPLGLMSPPRTTSIRAPKDAPPPKPAAELSPPPSPVAEASSQIDIEGIHDDIIVATIRQLERTGNRPHLVKELVAIFATDLASVEKSANPSALISSRLTAYLHRSWPAISPCPLAKDLSPVHPRRLYYYLTTCPRQPIPDVPAALPPVNRSIITPSLSSASAGDEEDRCLRGRQVLSPSPEVDLSSPELGEDHGDAPPTPGGSFSGRNSAQLDRPTYAHNHRRASPPLEMEERDFKQTASVLLEQAQARRTGSLDTAAETGSHTTAGVEQDHSDSSSDSSITMSIEMGEHEESTQFQHLFGIAEHLRPKLHMDFSSPMLQPQQPELSRNDSLTSPMKCEPDDEEQRSPPDGRNDSLVLPDANFSLDFLPNPESVELDELEDLFDAY